MNETVRRSIPNHEIESLCKLTDLSFIEVLNDFMLFRDVAELPVNYETWSSYKKEKEAKNRYMEESL